MPETKSIAGLAASDETMVVELGLRVLYKEIVQTFIEKGTASNPAINELMTLAASEASINDFVVPFITKTINEPGQSLYVEYVDAALNPAGTPPHEYLGEVYTKYGITPPKDGFINLISERDNWHDTKTARNGNYYVYVKPFFVGGSPPSIEAGKNKKFSLQKSLPAMMDKGDFVDFVKGAAVEQYKKDNPDTQIEFTKPLIDKYILLLGNNGYSFHLKTRPSPKKSQFFVRVFINDHGMKLESGIIDFGGDTTKSEKAPKGAMPEGIKKDFLVKNFLNGLETVIKAYEESEDKISEETKKVYDKLVPLKKAFTDMAKKNNLSETSTISLYFNAEEGADKFKLISVLDADTNHILGHESFENILKSNVILNEKVILTLNKLSCQYGDVAAIDLEPEEKEPEEEEEAYFESGTPESEGTPSGGSSLSTQAAVKKEKEKKKKKKEEKEKSKKGDITTKQVLKKTSGGAHDPYRDVLNPLDVKKAAKKSYRSKTKKMSNKTARQTLLEAFIDSLDMTEIGDCFIDAAPAFDSAILNTRIGALYYRYYDLAKKADPNTFSVIALVTSGANEMFSVVTAYQYKRIFSTIVAANPDYRNRPDMWNDLAGWPGGSPDWQYFQFMVTLKKKPNFKAENFIPLMIKAVIKQYVGVLASDPNKEKVRKFNNFYSAIAKKNIKLEEILEKKGDNKTDKEKIKAANKSKKKGSKPPTMDWKMASGLILNFWAIGAALMKKQIDEQKGKILGQITAPIISALQNEAGAGDPDDVERMDKTTAALASSNDLVENALESTDTNDFVNKVDFVKAIRKDVFPSNSYNQVVCLFENIANDIDFAVQVKFLSGNISLDSPDVELLKYILEDCELPSNDSIITKLFSVLSGYIDTSVVDKKIEHVKQIKTDYFEICEDNESIYLDNLRNFLDEDSANAQNKNVAAAAALQLKNLFGMVEGTALEDAEPNMYCQQGLDNKQPLMPSHYHDVSLNQQNRLMETIIKGINTSFNDEISNFKPMIIKEINMSLFNTKDANGVPTVDMAALLKEQVERAAFDGNLPDDYLENLWINKFTSKLNAGTKGNASVFGKKKMFVDSDGNENPDYFWYETASVAGLITYIVFNFTAADRTFLPLAIQPSDGVDENGGVVLQIEGYTAAYAIVNPETLLLKRRFISPPADTPGTYSLIPLASFASGNILQLSEAVAKAQEAANAAQNAALTAPPGAKEAAELAAADADAALLDAKAKLEEAKSQTEPAGELGTGYLKDLETMFAGALIGDGVSPAPTNSIFVEKASKLRVPPIKYETGVEPQNEYTTAIYKSFTNDLKPGDFSGDDTFIEVKGSQIPATDATIKDNVLINFLETIYYKVFTTFIDKYTYFKPSAFSGNDSIALTDKEFFGDGGLLCVPEIKLDFKNYRDDLQCYMEMDQRPDSYQLAHMFTLYQMLINVFLLQEMLKNIFLIFETQAFASLADYKSKDYILSSFKNLFKTNVLQVGTLSQNFSADLNLLYKYESFKYAMANPPLFTEQFKPSDTVGELGSTPLDWTKTLIGLYAGTGTPPSWPSYKTVEFIAEKIKNASHPAESHPGSGEKWIDPEDTLKGKEPIPEEELTAHRTLSSKRSEEWKTDIYIKYFADKYYNKILVKLKERVRASVEQFGGSSAEQNAFFMNSDGPAVSIPWSSATTPASKNLIMSEGEASKVSGWVFQEYIDIRQRINYGENTESPAASYVPPLDLESYDFKKEGSHEQSEPEYNTILAEVLALAGEDINESKFKEIFGDLFAHHGGNSDLTAHNKHALEAIKRKLASPGLTDILNTHANGGGKFKKKTITPYFRDDALGGLKIEKYNKLFNDVNGSVLNRSNAGRWALQSNGYRDEFETVKPGSATALTWDYFKKYVYKTDGFESPEWKTCGPDQDNAVKLQQAYAYLNLKDLNDVPYSTLVDSTKYDNLKNHAQGTPARFYANMLALKSGDDDKLITVDMGESSLALNPHALWYTPLSWPSVTYQPNIAGTNKNIGPLWGGKPIWEDFFLTQGKMSPVSFFQYYYIPYVLSMAAEYPGITLGGEAQLPEKMEHPLSVVDTEYADLLSGWSDAAKDAYEQLGDILVLDSVKSYKGWQTTNNWLASYGPKTYFSKVAVGTRACFAIPMLDEKDPLAIITDFAENLEDVPGLYAAGDVSESALKEALYEKMLDYTISTVADPADDSKKQKKVLLIPIFQKEIDILKTGDECEIRETWPGDSVYGGNSNRGLITPFIYNRPVEMHEVLISNSLKTWGTWLSEGEKDENGKAIPEGTLYDTHQLAAQAFHNYDWLGEMYETVRLQYFYMVENNRMGGNQNDASFKKLLRTNINNTLANIDFDRLVAESVRSLGEEVYGEDLEKIFDQTKESLLEAIYSLKAAIDGDWGYVPKGAEGNELAQVLSILQPLVKMLIKVLPIPGL